MRWFYLCDVNIDNLSFRFRSLIDQYAKLRKDVRSGGVNDQEISKETNEIAIEQRRLIENVVIRRSRLDLGTITRYKNDLQKQNISFPKIEGPSLVQYDLSGLSDLYVRTLDKLVENYTAARYQPTKYGVNFAMFNMKVGTEIDASGLRIGQINLANHMKRLLVMRFESSKDAFKKTLEKMIRTNKIVEEWWLKYGSVPILKKGQLPNPDDYTDEDGEISFEFDVEIERLSKTKGLIAIPKDMFEFGEEFYNDLRNDTNLLASIHDEWFLDKKLDNVDPKRDKLLEQLLRLIDEDPNRKIVVFSSYADTVNYLFESFKNHRRFTKYTAADSQSIRKVIKMNFDAAIPKKNQLDDFDVLFATDALSEGVNLHRAGIVINYDIPYNPTRVIQRVGRINRINMKIFDEIFVYNFFPTVIGEAETKLKQISTLKINLMNTVRSIPRRSRIQRRNTSFSGTVVYGKKGEDSVFALGNESEARIISVEEALPIFASLETEKAFNVDANFYNLMNFVKDTLFSKNSVPPIKGRRQKSISVLSAIMTEKPEMTNYCNDLIKLIKEYDDISEGTLKDISNINLNNLENIGEGLRTIISEQLVQNVLERVEKIDQVKESLLLVEEHINETR
jgi:hypothetical protein